MLRLLYMNTFHTRYQVLFTTNGFVKAACYNNYCSKSKNSIVLLHRSKTKFLLKYMTAFSITKSSYSELVSKSSENMAANSVQINVLCTAPQMVMLLGTFVGIM